MADQKISQLTSATTPLAGTEVLPIVQSSATVKVAVNDLTVRNFRAKATTGILQVAGPTAGTTRTMTTPDADFTAARTDAAQSFTGDQTLSNGNLVLANGKGLQSNLTTNFKAYHFSGQKSSGIQNDTYFDVITLSSSGGFGSADYVGGLMGTLRLSYTGQTSGYVNEIATKTYVIRAYQASNGNITVAVTEVTGMASATQGTITAQAKTGASSTSAVIEAKFASGGGFGFGLMAWTFECESMTNLANNLLTPATA